MESTTITWTTFYRSAAELIDDDASQYNETKYLAPECLGAPDKNYTDTYMSTGYSRTEVVVYSVLVALFCLYVLVGNVAVILVILRDRAINSQPQNQYLVSLAVADALLAVLVVPFTLVNELSGKWPFGPIYCQVYLATDVLLCTASIWGICAIGLDRYWSVKQPVTNQKKRTKKVVRFIIVAVWILSFAISVLPFIFGFKLIPTSAEESCFINDVKWYILFSCTLSFFLPTIIIAPVYTKIYFIGRKHSRPFTMKKEQEKARNDPIASELLSGEEQMFVKDPEADFQNGVSNRSKLPLSSSCNAVKPAGITDPYLMKSGGQDNLNYSVRKPRRDSSKMDMVENGNREIPCSPLAEDPNENEPSMPSRNRLFSATSATHRTFSVTSFVVLFKKKNRRPSEQSSKRAAYYHKRERRFTLIICLVTGGFLLCWYPFFQTYVVYALCGSACCINKSVFKFIFWLGYMNSGLNPAIYTIFNKEFRRAFRRLIRCRGFRKSSRYF